MASDPDATSTYPKDLVEAAAAGAANGVGFDRPRVVKVPEARELVGQPIVDAITGKDSAAAAEEAAKAFQALLDDENK